MKANNMQTSRVGNIVGPLIFGSLSVLQFVVTVAMATIAGYMVIGGIGGTVAMFAGAKSIMAQLPGIGWVAGGIFGAGSEIGRIRRQRSRPAKETDKDSEKAGDDSEGSPVTEDTPSRSGAVKFRIPTFGQLARSIGFGGVFGLIGGIIATVLLTVLLISVTTSPFVPRSWRARSHSISQEEMERARRTGSRQYEGVSSSFTHPLMVPLAMYATGTVVGLGLIGGLAAGFFEDEPEDKPAGDSA